MNCQMVLSPRPTWLKSKLPYLEMIWLASISRKFVMGWMGWEGQSKSGNGRILVCLTLINNNNNNNISDGCNTVNYKWGGWKSRHKEEISIIHLQGRHWGKADILQRKWWDEATAHSSLPHWFVYFTQATWKSLEDRDLHVTPITLRHSGGSVSVVT